VNDKILASHVRLIDEQGQQVGAMPLAEALAAARAKELDLVQVMADADPPVCKMMDYGKHQYKQKRQRHQAKTKSHVTHIKEIRLHPKTGQHDIDYRLKRAREFLARGDKLLITVLFKGRELAHMEAGEQILQRVASQLEDAAKIEQLPRRDGRRMNMMLIPK